MINFLLGVNYIGDDYLNFDGNLDFSYPYEGYELNPMGNHDNWTGLSQEQYNHLGNTALKALYGDIRNYKQPTLFHQLYNGQFEKINKITFDPMDVINESLKNPILE